MAENSVMLQLYLWHYLHNTVFIIKHKLYRPTGSQNCPPPPVKKIWVCIWTWLYCTLISFDDISNWNFITSNCTISEWRIGMDAERCDCDLIEVLSWHLRGWTEEKHGNYQSGQPRTWPRFEPGISNYKSRCSCPISLLSDALIIFRNIGHKIIYSNKI